jgi:pyruvate kinase
VETVEAMARICVEAEKSSEIALERQFLDRVFSRIDQSIAMAALFAAYHLRVKAIAALTGSGSIPLWMSRLNSGVPIYALTPSTCTHYCVSLFRGVTPLLIRYTGQDRDGMLLAAEQALIDAGTVAHGDLIVLTIGEPPGIPGGTNTMKIVRVREHLAATGKSQPEENHTFGIRAPAAQGRRRVWQRNSQLTQRRP